MSGGQAVSGRGARCAGAGSERWAGNERSRRALRCAVVPRCGGEWFGAGAASGRGVRCAVSLRCGRGGSPRAARCRQALLPAQMVRHGWPHKAGFW
eukprot:8993550-Lingulodinium_polyedra.AAC.1